MPEQHSTLRAKRRAETRRMIQSHAVRLFTERGYDDTAVTDVAEAAGVSPMTLYRHFPTKEDLVLIDEPVRLFIERISATSAAQPLVRRISSALIGAAATLASGGDGDEPTAAAESLLARLQLMITTPALRARHLDSNYALQQAIVESLGDDAADPDTAFKAHAAASACLAALHTALVRWAEDDGKTDLPDLIAKALAAAFGDDVVDDHRAG